MSLNHKQMMFASDVGKLLTYATRTGQPVILAEAFRTAYQAKEYARTGKGIKNSAHCKKLAVDLFRYEDGTIIWRRNAYYDLGKYWKGLRVGNVWGGDWKRRDCVHFSRLHKGVK